MSLWEKLYQYATKPRRALENYRKLKQQVFELQRQSEMQSSRIQNLETQSSQMHAQFLQMQAQLAHECEDKRNLWNELRDWESRQRWVGLPGNFEDDGILNRARYLEEEDCREDGDMDRFYLHLSNVLRGSEDAIRSGNEMFLPYVLDAAREHGEHPFLDFGCGRGEFLDLLQEHGVRAIGVDMNRESAQVAIDHGHEVVIGDALDYLESRPDGELSGLSMIMVSEHIPFPQFFEAVFLFARKIVSGGPLLINTINTYCYHRMGHFQMDPSHVNFIPAETYKLLMEMAGFQRIKILWSHPVASRTCVQDVHTEYENVTIIGYNEMKGK
ncbi:MAG: methyltransferase domain-containing protein [Selenomonadaceae bacterium]|nr:methyltransferase domain-containing protein [Selenomonadaceae bacterium]